MERIPHFGLKMKQKQYMQTAYDNDHDLWDFRYISQQEI